MQSDSSSCPFPQENTQNDRTGARAVQTPQVPTKSQPQKAGRPRRTIHAPKGAPAPAHLLQGRVAEFVGQPLHPPPQRALRPHQRELRRGAGAAVAAQRGAR
jgi:hypothetical protein